MEHLRPGHQRLSDSKISFLRKKEKIALRYQRKFTHPIATRTQYNYIYWCCSMVTVQYHPEPLFHVVSVFTLVYVHLAVPRAATFAPQGTLRQHVCAAALCCERPTPSLPVRSACLLYCPIMLSHEEQLYADPPYPTRSASSLSTLSTGFEGDWSIIAMVGGGELRNMSAGGSKPAKVDAKLAAGLPAVYCWKQLIAAV